MLNHKLHRSSRFSIAKEALGDGKYGRSVLRDRFIDTLKLINRCEHLKKGLSINEDHLSQHKLLWLFKYGPKLKYNFI